MKRFSTQFLAVLILAGYLAGFHDVAALVSSLPSHQGRAMSGECSCCSAGECMHQTDPDARCSSRSTRRAVSSSSIVLAPCSSQTSIPMLSFQVLQRDVSASTAFPEVPTRRPYAAEWAETSMLYRWLEFGTLFHPPRS